MLFQLQRNKQFYASLTLLRQEYHTRYVSFCDVSRLLFPPGKIAWYIFKLKLQKMTDLANMIHIKTHMQINIYLFRQKVQ